MWIKKETLKLCHWFIDEVTEVKRNSTTVSFILPIISKFYRAITGWNQGRPMVDGAVL